jgi:hypothetical protein
MTTGKVTLVKNVTVLFRWADTRPGIADVGGPIAGFAMHHAGRLAAQPYQPGHFRQVET